MALNEKAAMLICAVFTVGMPCVLHRLAAQIEVPSPLGLSAAAPNEGGGQPERAARFDVDPRAAWVRGFQRLSALDMQAAVSRTTQEALALVPPGAPPTETLALELPPLAVQAVEFTPLAELGDVAGATDDVVVAEGGDPVAPAPDIVVTHGARRYRVAKGDTLWRIARREWNSDDRRLVELLAEHNPGLRERMHKILVGEELVIPDVDAVQRVLTGASSSAGTVLADATPSKTEVRAALETTKPADAHWYTIQPKDTLARIARRYLRDGRRWREIVALNRSLDPQRIVPGTRIKLPSVMRMAQS
jgi:nucleoid-associated protein YgaU